MSLKNKKTRSLRTIILTSVLTVMMPSFFIFGVLGSFLGSFSIWNETIREFTATSSYVGYAVQTYQDQAKQAWSSISNDLWLGLDPRNNGGTWKFGPGLSGIFAAIPHFRSAIVAGQDGIVSDVFPRDPAILGNDISRQPYFTEARRQPWWSDAFVDDRTGFASLSFSGPVERQGYTGVVIFFLDFIPLQESLSLISQRRGAHLSLADRFGTIIADADYSRVARRETNQLFLEYRETQGQLVKDQDDHLVYLWNFPIPGSGWILHITMAAEQLLEPMVMYLILMLVLMILAAIATAIIVRRNIGRVMGHLRVIIEAAEQLGFGDFHGIAVPQEPSEFVTLGQAFNTMVDNLSQRESSIVELNKTLESKVFQRTQELQDRNQKLETTLHALQQAQEELVHADRHATVAKLVAGVAHEINTPLGVALTASTFLEDSYKVVQKANDAASLTKHQFVQFLETIGDSSRIINANLERAAHLIQTFKQLAVEQNVDTLRTFEIGKHILDLLDSLRPAWKHRPIEVHTFFSNPITVQGHPAAFSQIISNLVINSLTHGFPDERGGTIEIHLRNNADDPEFFDLVYQDDGVGMDGEVKAHIFDPFFTTKRNQGSTGLGMNIVYNLVSTKLGGNLVLESEPNQGMRLTFKLPLKGL